MIYKQIFIIFLSFLFLKSFAKENFGQYRYTKYIGIQQQLNNQRIINQRRNQRYYKTPANNIRYPSANNPYPNIQRNQYQRISPRQRYSPNYYQRYY